MCVVEMVSFSLSDGTPEQFVAASGEISDWVKQQKGFLKRQLGVADDGLWTDVIFWADMDCARAAGKRIMSEIGDCEAMRMIDLASIDMRHMSVQHEVGT